MAWHGSAAGEERCSIVVASPARTMQRTPSPPCRARPMRAEFKAFASALDVHMVEVSPAMRAMQWDRLGCAEAGCQPQVIQGAMGSVEGGWVDGNSSGGNSGGSSGNSGSSSSSSSPARPPEVPPTPERGVVGFNGAQVGGCLAAAACLAPLAAACTGCAAPSFTLSCSGEAPVLSCASAHVRACLFRAAAQGSAISGGLHARLWLTLGWTHAMQQPLKTPTWRAPQHLRPSAPAWTGVPRAMRAGDLARHLGHACR